MKYLVDVQGTRVEVVLDENGVRVGDQHVTAHLADIEGTPEQLVTLGDTVHRVVAQRGAVRGSYVLWIDGWRFDVEALDERTRTIRDLSAATSGPKGPRPLVAPMPGLVVRVLTAEGSTVRAGEPLVVMEAMKMENELRAPADGRVSGVRVKPGDAVEKGSVLIELA